MLQKKKLWRAFLVAVSLCIATLPMRIGAEESADPRNLYTDQILMDVAEYNAQGEEEKCGVFVDLIDLDFDGWPELYLAFLKQGQWSYAFAERAYTLRDGAIEPLGVDQGGLGLLLASEQTDRHQTYLVRDPSDGGRTLLITKYTHNEGSYDFGLMFYELRVMETEEGRLVLRTPLFGAPDLPEELTGDGDEKIQAFFDQHSEQFLSAYEIVATGIDAGFLLENREDWSAPLSLSRDEIFQKVSAYRPPKGL